MFIFAETREKDSNEVSGVLSNEVLLVLACFALLLSLVDIETVLDGALCLAIFLALRVSFLNVAFSICCFWIRLASIASVKEGFTFSK